MLSHVIYPAIPRLSLRTARGRAALALLLGGIALLLWDPALTLFPLGLLYVSYGVVRAVALGLLDRLPDRDLLSEELEAEEEETDTRDLEYERHETPLGPPDACSPRTAGGGRGAVTRYRMEVRVTPRQGLLDPEGRAVESALASLGFEEVADVRIGKLVRMRVDAESEPAALERTRDMCEQLIANPVTEDYEVRVLGEDGGN